MSHDYYRLSDTNIPIIVTARYGPQRYNYTCYFAQCVDFSGGYVFVDPADGASMSLYSILTEYRHVNHDAIVYLQQHYPELLL